MVTQYPNAVDNDVTLPNARDNVTPVKAEVVNRVKDAIVAVQNELGVKPSGTSGTLKARLDAMEAEIHSGSAGVFVPGRDLSGNSTLQTVVGIEGIPIASSIAPPVGGTQVYNELGTISYKPAKPKMPGYFDVKDYGAIDDWNGDVGGAQCRTGSVGISSNSLIVSDATDLAIGQYLWIAGLNATRLITNVSGIFVTISPVADATVTDALVVIDSLPAFQATLAAARAAGPGGIRINRNTKIIADGHFFLSNTLQLEQTITLEGSGQLNAQYNVPGYGVSCPGTWLIFPKNVDGIRIKSNAVNDPGGHVSHSGERTVIRNLTISCYDATTTSGHGIFLTTTTSIEHVTIQAMGGDGVHGEGNWATPPSGIIDNCLFADVNVATCKGNGFTLRGGDANTCLVQRCTAIINDGYGFYDQSFGNTYLMCHAEGNATANYRTEQDTNTSAFIGCYAENGPSCPMHGQVTIIGGFLSSADALTQDSGAFTLGWGNMGRQPLSYRNKKSDTNFRTTIGNNANEPISMAHFLVSANDDYVSQLALYYLGSSNPWWGYLLDNSPNQEVMRMPTALAHSRSYGPWMPNGLFIGTSNPNNQIKLQSDTIVRDTKPDTTAQTYEIGDIIFQSHPVAGGPIGYRCITSGTNNTLISVTGDISSGSTDLGIAGGILQVGQYINIVGVTGAKKVTGIGSSASVESLNAQPYILANGWTLNIKIDRGPVQTVTFLTADFVDIVAATATEVAAKMSASLVGCTVTATSGATKVTITSNSKGINSVIQVYQTDNISFPANTAIGFGFNEHISDNIATKITIDSAADATVIGAAISFQNSIFETITAEYMHIVYQPGGITSIATRTFATWAEVQSIIANINDPITIYIDDSISPGSASIPALSGSTDCKSLVTLKSFNGTLMDLMLFDTDSSLLDLYAIDQINLILNAGTNAGLTFSYAQSDTSTMHMFNGASLVSVTEGGYATIPIAKTLNIIVDNDGYTTSTMNCYRLFTINGTININSRGKFDLLGTSLLGSGSLNINYDTNINSILPDATIANAFGGTITWNGIASPLCTPYNTTLVGGDSYMARPGQLIKADTALGNITITLPALALVVPGSQIIVKATTTSANIITVSGTGADTIDGAASSVISPVASLLANIYVADPFSSNWHII